MDRIHRDSARDVWAVRSRRPALLEDPFGGEEFAAMIVELAPVDAGAWRQFAKALVKLGVRHVVCVGPAATERADEVTWASHDRFPDLDVPESKRVEAAGFGDGALRDAARRFVEDAGFAGFESGRHLLLCIGGDAERCQAIEDLVVAACRGELDEPEVVEAAPEPQPEPVPLHDHEFLFVAARWHARGTVVDAYGAESTLDAVFEVSHGVGRWTVAGRLAGFASVLRVRPFASGTLATVWESDNPALGRLDGNFAVVGDVLVSLFQSADGRHRGTESYRRAAADRYEVRGALFAGPVLASSWRFDLDRETDAGRH